MTIGIMCAMPEEANLLAQELAREREHSHGGRTYYTGVMAGVSIVLVFSRIGKVAAAVTAQHLIDVHRVRQIVFTGVAGGLTPRASVGDIVVAQHLWQHDMDASPLFPPLEIPLLGVSSIAADATISAALVEAAIAFASDDFEHTIAPATRRELQLSAPRVITGDIASGDRFIATSAERKSLLQRVPTAACVEMEGAAVAQVCFEQGVPLGVLRVISDGADELAAADFGRFIREAASLYGLGIVRRYLSGLA